ncbi:hypothetical protein C5167_000197 [Papaver somniferum]|uniref:Phytocyanin domain-containing protein n=1 Tax=Papaver somniferum TaxID=3469 RepID=A0A4Y7KT29_PAPSO|nr:stellacyanin-like [Papaver somniferum]RZC76016.1 hypothetical protein C5167_000197 [Papaver somniferum]
MSTYTMKTSLIFCIIFIFCFHQYFTLVVHSLEYDVGDTKGWVVPQSNASNIYNEWASKKRFQIEDSIRFKYGKDSVMVVSETDYKACNSTQPMFFSNNGNTIFKLDRSGYFYFISGVSGHCERGQKMIIKVLAIEEAPSGDGNTPGSSGAASISCSCIVQMVLLVVAGSAGLL